MPKRIAIIGSGPIGLEAALYARTLGYDVVVYERGEVGDNVSMWGFVRMFSPWSVNTTVLGRRAIEPIVGKLPLDQNPTGSEFREKYLLPLSRCEKLAGRVREKTRVLVVSRADAANSGTGKAFRIRLTDASGAQTEESADLVLDCSGTYTFHAWAGRGGIPVPGELRLNGRIFYTIPDVLGRDRERFAGRHALLMGCGYAAAIALRDLQELAAQQPRTTVTWAVRRPDQAIHPILNDPLRSRQLLVHSMLQLMEHPPGWLRYLSTATLESVGSSRKGLTASLRSNGRLVCVAMDELVSLIGFGPDNSILDHQVQPSPTTRSSDTRGSDSSISLDLVPATPPDAPRPDFFILGAKSYGTNANFLLQAGHMQICDAFAQIEGKAGLDLYQ